MASSHIAGGREPTAREDGAWSPERERATADALAIRAMEEMPGVSVLVFDLSFRYRAVFGSAVREHGHDPDKMVGRRAPDVLPAAVWQGLAPLYARVTAGETFVEEVRSRDGSHIFETTFSPIMEGDRPVGGVIAARDVTSERKAMAALARSEELHRMIAETSADVVSRADLEGTYTYVSEAARRVYGWAPEDLVGRSAFDLVHPEDQARVRGLQAQLVGGAIEEADAEYRHRCKDGTWLWVEGRTQVVRDRSGAASGLQASTRDISERRRTGQELAQAKELFELAFTSAPIGMALLDPDGRWLRVNPALCALVERDETALLATSLPEISHPEDAWAERRLARQTLEGRRDWYRVEMRLSCPDGSWCWTQLSVALARNADGGARWFIAQFEDIGERREIEERLRHQATHDQLTGVYNRARLREELQRCVVEHDRYGHPAVLLSIDLDGFKPINDGSGHEVGDEHLRAVARAIEGALRESDFCGRQGGDEFAVLLPNTEESAALVVADRINVAIREVGPPVGSRLSTTASIGLAPLDEGLDVDGWLRAADRTMYEAKRAGGDQVGGVADQADGSQPGPRRSSPERRPGARE